MGFYIGLSSKKTVFLTTEDGPQGHCPQDLQDLHTGKKLDMPLILRRSRSSKIFGSVRARFVKIYISLHAMKKPHVHHGRSLNMIKEEA